MGGRWGVPSRDCPQRPRVRVPRAGAAPAAACQEAASRVDSAGRPALLGAAIRQRDHEHGGARGPGGPFIYRRNKSFSVGKTKIKTCTNTTDDA